jgi:hypothetical protein
MKTRDKFLHFAVFGFYLCYALLPLLYSTTVDNAESLIDPAYASPLSAQPSILNQNLFLIAAEDRHTASAPATAEVLLKKKRAITPSVKNTGARLFSHSERFTRFASSFKNSFLLWRTPVHALNCPDGFPYYYSGISPPSA